MDRDPGLKPLSAILPSLENLAALRTAAALWEEEFSKLLSKSEYLKSNPEKRLIEHASRLDIPRVVKNKVSILVKKMYLEMRYGFNIDDWPSKTRPCTAFMKHIMWTNMATINHIATVRSLINSNIYTDEEIFTKACNNCIVSLIYEFGPKVAAEPNFHRFPFCVPLVLFWTCCLTDDMDTLNTLTQYSVEHPAHYQQAAAAAATATEWRLQLRIVCAENGKPELVNAGDAKDFQCMLHHMLLLSNVVTNQPAFAFFWRMLDQEYRERVLSAVVKEYDCEDLHLLILDLTPEQQRTFLAKNGNVVLCNYLDNPLELEYTLRMAYRLRDTLTVPQLREILIHLDFKICEFAYSPAKENYHYAFVQLWEYVPAEFRRAFLVSEGALLRSFTRDFRFPSIVNFMGLALEGASKPAAVDALSSVFGKHICSNLLEHNELHILKELLPADVRVYEVQFNKVEKFDSALKILKKSGNGTLFGRFLELAFRSGGERKEFQMEFPEYVASELRRNSASDFMCAGIIQNDLETLDGYVKKCSVGEGPGDFVITASFKEKWPSVKETVVANLSRRLGANARNRRLPGKRKKRN